MRDWLCREKGLGHFRSSRKTIPQIWYIYYIQMGYGIYRHLHMYRHLIVMHVNVQNSKGLKDIKICHHFVFLLPSSLPRGHVYIKKYLINTHTHHIHGWMAELFF